MSKVIIFPTDTVYGIGASVFDREGIERIYNIKKRPHDKPLAVLCANKAQIEEISIIDDNASKLIDNFLPGALTLILSSKEIIKESMGLDKVGVRIPNYQLAINLLNENGPMATTSVNESGRPSINEYHIIKDEYNDLVEEIYPPTDEDIAGLASTVVDITSGEVIILREGAITKKQIENIIK